MEAGSILASPKSDKCKGQSGEKLALEIRAIVRKDLSALAPTSFLALLAVSLGFLLGACCHEAFFLSF